MNSQNIRVFQSQDILCPDNLGQPLCIASSDSLFWVAFHNVIKGYSTQTTQKEFHCLYEFQPLWPIVDDIHYLPDIRRIITVERRVVYQGTSGDSVVLIGGNQSSPNSPQVVVPMVEQCCRIYYFDYDKKQRKTNIQPYTLPIQLISNANEKTLNKLLASVCTYSNQLLTCSRDVISLWKFTNSASPTCILKLHSSWNIKCISIFNQFIGYGTTRDVRVIELKQKEIITDDSTDTAMAESDMDELDDAIISHLEKHDIKRGKSTLEEQRKRIETNIKDQIGPMAESPVSPRANEILNVRAAGPLTKTMAIYWGISQLESNMNENDEIQIRFDMSTKEPVPSPATQTYTEHITAPTDKKKKNTVSATTNIAYDIVGETPTVDHPTFVNNKYIQSCVNLLHKHFTNDESPRSIHFLQNISQKKDFKQNTGMKCIISTSTCGYVYGLSSPQTLQCEFEYTGECLMSAVNSLFLYAITPVGLEVWSVLGSRTGCLLRFHPFIGLKSVAATDKHVVLLSRFSSNENVSIAAYYNQSTDKTVLVSDMRSIEKMSKNAPTKEGRSGRLLPIFSARKKKEEVNQGVETPTEEYSYNIYALNAVELSEIYEDMLEHAMMAKNEDRATYMKLLRESHSLLQSKYFELMAKEKKAEKTETDPINLLKMKLELQTYTTMLRRSFGLSGDAFIETDNPDQAAYAYSNSDRFMSDVFKKLESREEYLLLFLDYVLFNDETDPATQQHTEDLGNQILTIYKQRIPHKLSNVILESNLKSYSKHHAIKLIEEIGAEFVKAQQLSHLHQFDDLNMFEPPQLASGEDASDDELLLSWCGILLKDAMVLALLYLQVGNREKSIKILQSIESHCIVEFMVSNPNLLMPSTDEKEFSAFSVLLREYFPWCLIEILARLNASKTYPLDSSVIFKLLSGEGVLLSEKNSDLTSKLLQQIYLSSLLLSTNVSSDISKLKEHSLNLMKVLVSELSQMTKLVREQDIKELLHKTKTRLQSFSVSSPSGIAPSSDNLSPVESTPLFSKVEMLQELRQFSSFLQYSFLPFRENLAWLRSFVNYEFERDQNYLNSEISPSLVSEKLKDVSEMLDGFSTAEGSLLAISEHDPLLFLIYVLYSAQGLICFFIQFFYDTPNTPDSQNLFDEFVKIVEASDKFIGYETIKMLCITGANRFKESIEWLLGVLGTNQGESVSETAKELHLDFKPQIDIMHSFLMDHSRTNSDWNTVLEIIFTEIQLLEANQSNGTTSPQFVYPLLEQVLTHIANSVTPEDFLALLPKNGSMKYFFPFIQSCFANFTLNLSKTPLPSQLDILE